MNDAARFSSTKSAVFCLAVALQAAMSHPSASRASVPPQRCDVRTAPLSGPTGCIDMGKLDGSVISVPGSVTRLSTEGVVLCDKGGARVPGTDIVYIIDQSGSMTSFKESQFVLPHGKDTINFKGCGSWKEGGKSYPGTVPLVDYLGYSVKLLDSSWFDSAMANCEPSGDPYQARANVVQAAIVKQSQMAPTSRAAWIGFGTTYQSSKLFDLGANASRDSLAGGVVRQNLDKTYYAPPVGWARAMLQGAVNGDQAMPASPNKRKAIIMVSDGAPNDWADVAPMLIEGAKVKSPDGSTWILPDAKSPPVYGFMLSTDASQGDRLRDLAQATGGQYYLIPPLDRDSLNRVMDRLLGLLIDPGIPDSLVIQNLSNGQVSKAVSAAEEGGGYRFRLDSLLGLQSGINELLLRNMVHNAYGDTVLTAKWTLNVTDSVITPSVGGGQQLLETACFEPSRLRVRPSSDSSRSFADERDSAVRTFLDVRTDGQAAFRVGWNTSVSGDAGSRVFRSPDPGRALMSFDAIDPWSLRLEPPVTSDAIVQTRRGRDTLRVVFRMARDPRDSATGVLPLFHSYPVSLTMSPDTVSGLEGRFQLTVSDSNLLVDTAVVLVKHRGGDSVHVIVRHDGSGLLRGAFTFRQNSTVTDSDTILQMGPARMEALDTVLAVYKNVRDTGLVRRVNTVVLRFLDAAGVAHDTFSIDTLVRSRVRVRLQTWYAWGPVAISGIVRITGSDIRFVVTDSTGNVGTEFPMADGRVDVWVRSDFAVRGASLEVSVDSIGAKSKSGPLSWRGLAPDSAIYLDRDGDGALDQIRVHFQLPWNPVNVLHFPWPDAAHSVDLTGSVVSCTGDSMVATWNLAAPQSPGTTAWHGGAQRGWFAWNAEEPVSSFAIREAIAPIPLRARLIRGDPMDTLRVVVSESVNAESGAQWLRLGKPSDSPLGEFIGRMSQSSRGSDTLDLIVDSSFPGGIGDSIRLAASPAGGVADLGGNTPGALAAWVPLEIGRPRLKLDARPWPALSNYIGWEVPASEPVLSWYTRPGPGVEWRSGTGDAPRQELSHYSGVSIRTNRELDAGVVYLYDNSGVSVATLDLAPLFQSVRDGVVETNARGDIEVWVAWNGTTSTGRIAASGVYLARVLAWRSTDGERAVVNQVHRLGWNVPDRFRQAE